MNELRHFGIKGMKWGVRRYQNKDGTLTPSGKKRYNSDGDQKMSRKDKKAARKEVDTLSKGLVRSGQNVNLATATAYAKFDPKDYEKAAQLVKQGRVLVNARFEKNYKDRSVDVYFDNDKTPTIRTRLQNGEMFSAEFLNKADQTRYEDFVKYLQN